MTTENTLNASEIHLDNLDLYEMRQEKMCLKNEEKTSP